LKQLNALEATYYASFCEGYRALFQYYMLDKSTVPEDMYMYNIEMSNGKPLYLHQGTIKEHYGTLLTFHPLTLNLSGILWLNEQNFAIARMRFVSVWTERSSEYRREPPLVDPSKIENPHPVFARKDAEGMPIFKS